MNFDLDQALLDFEKQQSQEKDQPQSLINSLFNQSSNIIISALNKAKEEIRNNQTSSFSNSDLESFDKELSEELSELNENTINPPNLNLLLNTFSATLKSVIPCGEDQLKKREKVKEILNDSLNKGYSEVILKSIAIEAFNREDFEMLSSLKKENLFKMEWIKK